MGRHFVFVRLSVNLGNLDLSSVGYNIDIDIASAILIFEDLDKLVIILNSIPGVGNAYLNGKCHIVYIIPLLVGEGNIE